MTSSSLSTQDSTPDNRCFLVCGQNMWTAPAMVFDELVERVQIGGRSELLGDQKIVLEIGWSSDRPNIRLIVDHDSWHLLTQYADLLEFLSAQSGKMNSPQEFCKILEAHGFTNVSDHIAYGERKLFLEGTFTPRSTSAL